MMAVMLGIMVIGEALLASWFIASIVTYVFYR